MDVSSDSDDEFSGARYPLETSPQENKTPNGGSINNSSLNGRMDNSCSHRNHWESLAGRGGRIPVGRLGFAYDEPSDSAASSVKSTTPTSQYVPEASTYRANGETVKQTKNYYDDDIASAPPLFVFQRANQVAGNPSTSRDDISAYPSTSGCSATDVEPSNKCKNTPLGATEVSTHEPSVRTAAGSSQSLPSRYILRFMQGLSKLYFSGLGYWYSVTSYDACVRLCLHSWSKQCMDAPEFLKNECVLLRDACGLRNVLLQPEEDLLKKQSSELQNLCDYKRFDLIRDQQYYYERRKGKGRRVHVEALLDKEGSVMYSIFNAIN